MRDRQFSSPLTYFFLMFPSGISTGFLSVTLPFIFTRAGVPVATTAAVVAIGNSANVWRFLWAPLADLSLSTHIWYLIGIVGAAATLLLVGIVPPHPGALLTGLVFLSQVASSVIMLPIGGMIAHTVVEEKKGSASGWYQAGAMAGIGVGGGVGVWLAAHSTSATAGSILAAAMLACAPALYFVPNVRAVPGTQLRVRLRGFGRDFWDLIRTRRALLVIVLVSSPIGVGAASQLWSAVAPDWHVTPDTVALVTGVLAGVVGGMGCIVGGWLCDRLGRFWVFFGGGGVVAGIAIVLAVLPRTPHVYAVGVLAYALAMGAAYGAYTALIFYAIGKGAASAKYAIFASFGNVPVAYMTAFDGWAHDRWGVSGMLNGEALLGLACIAFGLVALWNIERLGGLKVTVRAHA